MKRKIAISREETEAVCSELPEIAWLDDPDLRRSVISVWVSFLRESACEQIADLPAFPPLPQYDLARHTRQVTVNAVRLADTMEEFWDYKCDRQALIAACLLHDASKLVEWDKEGRPTELGRALLHAQIAGVRCLEFGLPAKVAHLVSMHPYTPPHVHVKPQYVEFVLLSWADLAAADTLFFRESLPTHFEIDKRFFQIG